MRQESLKQILFREDVPTDVKDVIKEYIQDTDSAEKLVENNEILSTVLETSPVGISLFTGPILGWTNDALAQMIGYKSDFLSGKKARILLRDLRCRPGGPGFRLREPVQCCELKAGHI